MRRTFTGAAFLISLMTPVLADPAPAQRPNPVQRALAQMVKECADREVLALVQSQTAQDRIAELTERLAAETKRADDAESRLKADAPSDPTATR